MAIHVLCYVSRHLCVSCVWNSYYNSTTSAESISKFGSGLFLLVQVVLLLDFVHGWNENWVAKDEQFWLVACCCYFLYLLGLPLVFFLYYLYSFVAAGTWLCWLSRLSVTLPRSLSRVSYFTGSLHLDMTADSTCFSLSSRWFLFLRLLLLPCTQRYHHVACFSPFYWFCICLYYLIWPETVAW